MVRAFQLGYVEIEAARFDEEFEYYDSVIGTSAVERIGTTAYLSFGLDHHNIALVSGAESRLAALGICVTGGELSDVAKKLRQEGLQAQLRSDARPGVSKLIEVTVPGRFVVHLYQEMAATAPGFRDSGVVPNRLGHVAVISSDAERLVKFFIDVLGFKLTDEFENNLARFITCNRDHHVLNVITAPISKLHHIAFELRDRSHHIVASDLLGSAKIPIVWGPARHTAGHNIASYHFSPSRFLMEFYVEMDVFVPELNRCEPRPWHEELPLRPRVWPLDTVTTWGTKYDFDFTKV
jgi:catechol 2,3-dioxygenase-like lactoylglutathione lyase family enzyme